MNKTVKKYFNEFRDLELNKSTEDVANDLQQLQIKSKLRYYGFYTVTILLSVWIYSSTLNYIEKNPFNKALIEENGVSPIATLFYSDYQKVYKKADKKLDELSNQIIDLQKDKRAVKGFYYSKNQFLKDIKDGKVKLDLKFSKKSIQQYQKAYMMAYLIQHGNENITLNNHDYTISKIRTKVSTMNDREGAYTKLDLPAKAILGLMKLDKSADNITLAKEALFDSSHLNYSDKRFYSGVRLSDFNPINEFKKAVLVGSDYYRIRGGGYSSITIKVPSINAKYQEHKKELKMKYDADIAKIKAKAKIAEQKIASSRETIKDLQRLKSEINALKIDVSHYDDHKQKIEKILDGYKMVLVCNYVTKDQVIIEKYMARRQHEIIKEIS